MRCMRTKTCRLSAPYPPYAKVRMTNTPMTSPSAALMAMRRKMAARARFMVATTAASTLMVTTLPTMLPRPRQLSKRCMLEATMPRTPKGRERKMRKGATITMIMLNAIQSDMMVRRLFHAAMASGRSGTRASTGNAARPGGVTP